MDVIANLFIAGSLVATIMGAIWFGSYLEKKQHVENMAVLTIAMIAMGAFIFWILSTQGSKIIANLLEY